MRVVSFALNPHLHIPNYLFVDVFLHQTCTIILSFGFGCYKKRSYFNYLKHHIYWEKTVIIKTHSTLSREKTKNRDGSTLYMHRIIISKYYLSQVLPIQIRSLEMHFTKVLLFINTYTNQAYMRLNICFCLWFHKE